MARNYENRDKGAVPRTAADVIADGWREGDDIDIGFIAVMPAQPQNGKTQQGNGRRRK
jgi:hypothetical protein